MAIQAQSQQYIGFSIGTGVTTPAYVLPAESYNHEESAVYNQLKATFGSRDNLYTNTKVGYDGLALTIKMKVDEVIFPVLLAAGMNSTVSGTTPNFINTLIPRNTVVSSGSLTREGHKLTFFVTDGDNGVIKYEGKILGEASISVESETVYAEFTFDSGTKEVLSGTPLTTALTAFATFKSDLVIALNALKTTLGREVNLDDYYNFARPSYCTVEYGDDYTFAASTISNADFGFSFGFNNNLTGEPQTSSAPGTFINPTMFMGGFSSNFEYTVKTLGNDLMTRNEANTPTCFRFRIQRNANRRFDFIFSPSSFVVTNNEKAGDSDDPVMQTVTQENANNTVVNPSLKILANTSMSLAALYPN